MKRITCWPQLFLGLTFNWGALLGWSAVHQGMIDWTVIMPLYAAGIFWTLIYDTIYAYQDINYDKKAGIKSTAVRFGAQPKVWLSMFSAAMLSNFLVVGLMSNQTWPYYAALGLSAARLGEIVYNLNIQNTKDCGRRFHQNQQIGLIMLIGIIVGTLFKPVSSGTKKSSETNDSQQSNEQQSSLD
jgi:4-hydroxybenzoate polyprenyltransferase